MIGQVEKETQTSGLDFIAEDILGYARFLQETYLVLSVFKQVNPQPS